MGPHLGEEAGLGPRRGDKTQPVLLDEGAQAPAFSLEDHQGQTISLTDLTGKWVVLWWYPKAATPG